MVSVTLKNLPHPALKILISKNLKEFEYDGIADSGMSTSNSICPGAWLNSNTQFIIGLDFRAGPKGALNSGISLARSNLEIELDMVDNPTTATNYQLYY